MRQVLRFLAAGLLLLPLPANAQSRPPAPITAGGGTVTILHFNDVYEITPVDGGAAGGLARVATLRARLKAREPGLITTLGGDYVSPSALGTARVNGERLAGRQMVAVLNVLGLDWATFGNHEFDIPESALSARLAESKFRLVSSNVTDAGGALFPNTVTRRGRHRENIDRHRPRRTARSHHRRQQAGVGALRAAGGGGARRRSPS